MQPAPSLAPRAALAALLLLAAASLALRDAAPAAAEGDPYETQSARMSDDESPFDHAAMAIDGVFGVDNRTQVLTTTAAPASMVVFLVVEWETDRLTTCSGFMIGPRTVGTSGHCLHQTSEGGWPSRVLAIPGANGRAEPFGRAWAESTHSVRGWTEGRDTRFDFGAITLESDLGTATGTFGMRAEPNSALTGATLAITGYPGEKPLATMWEESGRIDGLDTSLLYFRLDATKGNSGGPVWIRALNGDYFVLGIIKGGNDSTNVAVRMSQSVIDSFIGWRDGAASGGPGASVAPPLSTVTAAPRTLVATPSVMSAAVGAVAMSIVTIGAFEGGGDVHVSSSGGGLIADARLTPRSCGGGAAVCRHVNGNETTSVTIPDEGNDVSTVRLTAAGTVRSAVTVIVTATQGAQTWRITIPVTVLPGGAAPVTTATPTPAPTVVGSVAPPAVGDGRFANTPVYSPGALRLAQVVFNGGSVAQLGAALGSANASGAWAQSSSGAFVIYIEGAPAFANAGFVTAFPSGFAGVVALTIVGR